MVGYATGYLTTVHNQPEIFNDRVPPAPKMQTPRRHFQKTKKVQILLLPIILLYTICNIASYLNLALFIGERGGHMKRLRPGDCVWLQSETRTRPGGEGGGGAQRPGAVR